MWSLICSVFAVLQEAKRGRCNKQKTSGGSTFYWASSLLLSNYVKFAIHYIIWSQMYAANAQATYEHITSVLGDSSGKRCHMNVEASKINNNLTVSSTTHSGKHREHKSYFFTDNRITTLTKGQWWPMDLPIKDRCDRRNRPCILSKISLILATSIWAYEWLFCPSRSPNVDKCTKLSANLFSYLCLVSILFLLRNMLHHIHVFI